MSNWTTFWHMGGYAFYVWSAYGVTLMVLVASFVMPVRRHRLLRRELKNSLRQSPG